MKTDLGWRGLPRISEHDLQLAVVKELAVRMPKDIPWTSVDHAAKLSLRQAAQRKARGVKKGQPDLRFVIPPHGQSAEIELKIPGTYQTPEQKAWQCAAVKAGGLYAVCRSMAEVEGTLKGWGVELIGRAA